MTLQTSFLAGITGACDRPLSDKKAALKEESLNIIIRPTFLPFILGRVEYEKKK